MMEEDTLTQIDATDDNELPVDVLHFDGLFLMAQRTEDRGDSFVVIGKQQALRLCALLLPWAVS